jgi:hypothetical protein
MPAPILLISTLPQTLIPSSSIKANTAEVHIPSTPGNPGNITVLVKLGPELGHPRLWVELWEPQPTSFGVDPLAVMLAVSPDIKFKYYSSFFPYLPLLPLSFSFSPPYTFPKKNRRARNHICAGSKRIHGRSAHKATHVHHVPCSQAYPISYQF